MTKKTTFTKSIKKNRVAPSGTNFLGSARQDEQEFSLSEAVKKIAREINKILDHGYSREDVAAILGNDNIGSIKEFPSNNRISNIAVELLPKSTSCTDSPRLRVMASYNDSNRVPDHKTRWNSR